ncbi:MAG: hypothetical protein CMM58_10405 [Rhodospirillaceae bacterium]|nr:hypothetical protein [Rhodospirillaceae bacterium]
MTDFALGIDIGGTFTDVVALNLTDGSFQTSKVLTTPDNPQNGASRGVDHILKAVGGASKIARIIHATTLFSNALIERNGAKTGLITSKGFRDTLQLRRERKYDIYDLFLKYPDPLISRDFRMEIPERISSKGQVINKLSDSKLIEAAEKLIAKGACSIAIAFLNSNLNPAHEERAAKLLHHNFPELSVTISSEISRESGEYERTSTAAINAYIKPLANEYIDGLVSVLSDQGITAPLMLMLSNGGLTHASEAKRSPVQLLESGPAAGALSAALVGNQQNENRLIAFDMGGTTAKLAIVDDGQPEVAFSFEAARERRFAPGSGLPVRITTVELVEIGAGGGSIAKRDPLGLMKVGPQSAGSVPGPVCYSRGGVYPTVTDADLQLGYLSVDGFSENSLQITADAANTALADLGAEFKLGAEETALGIHEVVCENMAMAAQIHMFRKGRDPRKYSLYATGGAAPVHACAVARRLGIGRIIIPPAAGVASALGLTIAPARSDKSAAISRIVSSLNISKLEKVFDYLETAASAVVNDSAPCGANEIKRLAELRYSGQGAVLVVDITNARNHENQIQYIIDTFHNAHKEAYGRAFESIEIEFMTARVTVEAATVAKELRPKLPISQLRKKQTSSRSILLPGNKEFEEVTVYLRENLNSGDEVIGPAIIEEGQSTTVLPGHTRLVISNEGSMIIDILEQEQVYDQHVTNLDDPIHLEILWNQMIAAVDEAAASLLRSAFSTVVRESYDFSCIITDIRGRSLVQATDSIPSFIGTLPDTVKHFIKEFSLNGLSSNDVLITNDPHMGTGHLPDISVCRPLFKGKTLIGFAASTAHAPDIGGKIRSPEPREVFEEGLQIPPLKLYEKGKLNETLMSILRKNVRVADQVEGDLEAQLGALYIMEKRVEKIVSSYNLDDLSKLSAAVGNRTEDATRNALKNLPDGQYTSSVTTDGIAGTPIQIRSMVKIAGDEIEIDFSGSSNQVSKAINCPLCYTRAMAAYAIKSALAPEIPNNDGALRPITVVAPSSSIVNPSHPASVGSRVLSGHFIPALVMEAISEIAPDNVLAGAGSPIWCVNINGFQQDGEPIAGLFFFNGGMGASSKSDGLSCVSWPSNISSTPAEEIEQRLPIRIIERTLRRNSGGKGLFKGGDGQIVEFEYIGAKPGIFAFLAERTQSPARGIAGGGSGRPGKLQINGKSVDPKRQHIVSPGGRIVLATPGGGGYGKISQKTN